MEELLNENQVAKFLNKAVQSLRNDRHQGKGLPYLKLGRSVRYRPADIQKHIETCMVQPEN